MFYLLFDILFLIFLMAFFPLRGSGWEERVSLCVATIVPSANGRTRRNINWSSGTRRSDTHRHRPHLQGFAFALLQGSRIFRQRMTKQRMRAHPRHPMLNRTTPQSDAQVVLVQTFRDPPADFGAQEVEEICRLASDAINAAETSTTTTATTPGSTMAGAVSFLPVWNDRRKKERRRRGGGSGAEYGEDEGPPPHKLSSDHEPLPEALGVKVSNSHPHPTTLF